MDHPPASEDFTRALRRIFDDARRDRLPDAEVKAADLHGIVEGYPGPDHRMPSCCGAKRKAMGPGDAVIEEPPKGDGPSLTIRYRL